MTTLADREGGGPAASPARAQVWLRAWASIGGGVTIGIDRSVNPWRLVKDGNASDEVQTLLLREMEQVPGLKAAVRVIISTDARIRADRALRAMGRPGLSDTEGETRP